MKTLIDTKPWLQEAALLPFPWRDAISHLSKSNGKKLKVGVLWDDGVVKPHPPVIRAISEVVSKLKESPNIEVVDWKPYKHDEAWEIIASLYFCDGGREETEAIDRAGEPWRPLSKFIIKDNPFVKPMSVDEVWKMTMRREEYRNAYAQVWMETATGVGPDGSREGMVDVILCPVGPGAAPPLNQARYWGYTAQWNILDYPALIFPVTKVDPKVDKADTSYTPKNEKDEFNHKLGEFELLRGLHGIPNTYREQMTLKCILERRCLCSL
jgi:amidase